jgi:hypothetical protein
VLLSDLSQPTADITITTRAYPFELNDYIGLPPDKKQRYPQDDSMFTVVAKTENYSSGDATAEYKLRVGLNPTRGRAWSKLVLSQFGAPVPPSNFNLANAHGIPDTLREKTVTSSIKKDTLRFEVGATPDIVVKDTLRGESWRVFASASSDFVPSTSNELANLSAHGGAVDVDLGKTTLGGTKVTPGVPLYYKVAAVDKFGNVGPIEGLATAPVAAEMVLPRFKPITASVEAFNPTGNNLVVDWTTFTQCHLTATALVVSGVTYGHDAMVLFNQSGGFRRYRMPCDGIVAVSAQVVPALVSGGSGTGHLVMRVSKFNRDASSTLMSSSDAKYSNSLTTDSFLAANRVNFGWVIQASSGEYIALEMAKSSGTNIRLEGDAPGTSHAASRASRVCFTLLNEHRHGDIL